MKHKIITIVAFILFSQHIFAQNTKSLSLDNAIQLSLQNSKQLKLSQTKVKEATAILHQSQNNMIPDLKASGSYLRINNPNIDLKAKLGSSSGGSDTSSKSSSSFNVNEVMYGIISASVPVFSGFKIHYGIQSAKYLEQAAKLDADHDREMIIQNTIDAYTNLYKAGKAVDLVKSNLKQSQQRVSDFSNLEKNGVLARNDLLKAQLQESNIELSLLDAENNLKITNVNMDLMLGLQEGTEIIPDSLHPVTADNKNITDWELTAMQNRKDMQALAYREKAAHAYERSIKGEYYPSVALTGGYIALNIPDFLTVTNALNAGIGVNYNIGSLWKSGAKVNEAKAHVQEMQISEQILSDQVHIQVTQAYENYLLSQKKVDVYTKALEQATENYRITKNKYDNSLTTTTELLDADVAELQAKLNFAFANADVVVAYKKLLQTTGTLNNK